MKNVENYYHYVTEVTNDELLTFVRSLKHVDELDEFDGTLLMAACGRLQLEKVKLLLELGADPNFRKDRFCNTPLLEVITNSYQDVASAIAIIQVLLDKGADIEKRGENDMTPFLRACGGSSVNILRILIDRGCDPKATVDDGVTNCDARYFAMSAPEDVHKFLDELQIGKLHQFRPGG